MAVGSSSKTRMPYMDFLQLQKFALDAIEVFEIGPQATRFYLQIVKQTLGHRRLQAVLSTDDFTRGNPFTQTTGMSLPDSNIRRSRGRLLRSDLIQVKKLKGGKWWYRLNLPFILQSLAKMFKRHPSKKLKDLITRVVDVWQNLDWVEDSMTTIVEEYAAGKNLTTQHRQKVADKLKNTLKHVKAGDKARVVSTWVKTAMEELCEEYGFQYKELWTGRDKQSAKMWLVDISKQGLEAKEALRPIIKNWVLLHTNLQNEKGLRLILFAFPTFRQIFKFRREIDNWVITHDVPKRETSIRYEAKHFEEDAKGFTPLPTDKKGEY